MLRRSSSCSVRNLCRSSRAENSSSASGLIRPSWASARSAVRSRLACCSRSKGTGAGSSSPSATSPTNGTSWSGPYSATRDAASSPSSSRARSSSCSIRIRCWVRAISSRWVSLTSSSSSRPRSRNRVRASRSWFSRPTRPASTRLRSAAAEAMDSSSRASTTAVARPTASPTRPSWSSCSRRAMAAARASRSALRGAEQRVGPAVEGAGPLLGRAQGEPGLHLRAACGTGQLGEPVTLGRVRLLVGCVLHGREPRLELGQAAEVGVAGSPGRLDRLVEPGRLGAGVA